jgi:hypothetical protein
LAAAYAEAGRFPEAVDAARQAIELAAAKGQQSLAERVRGRLQQYESRQPYHVSPPAP